MDLGEGRLRGPFQGDRTSPPILNHDLPRMIGINLSCFAFCGASQHLIQRLKLTGCQNGEAGVPGDDDCIGVGEGRKMDVEVAGVGSGFVHKP